MMFRTKKYRNLIVLLLLLMQPLFFYAQVDKRKNKQPTTKTNTATRATNNGARLEWILPNTDETGISFPADKEMQKIKIKAISNRQLAAKDIKVYVNNKALDSSKFDEGSMTRPKKTIDNKYSHTFAGNLRLKEGENTIRVEYTENGKRIKTETISVNYYPERVNLHVLAIGPHHANLQFTSKDAQDFADAFKNQKGLLFKEVFVNELVTPERTKKDEIRVGLQDLKHRFNNPQNDRIQEKDLMVVYISSHGKEVDDRFKILTTGYRAGYEDIFSLDFEQDIIRVLDQINCKKLIFIDACNSGAAEIDDGSKDIADEDMAKALHKLLETNPGLTTFTSCQKTELSYEDAKWQNGAFTEAILAAFDNKSLDGYFPDADGDKILSLGELKDYIQKYVPHIVKKDKPNSGSQIPHVTISELPNDFPIYAQVGYTPPSVLPQRDINERWVSNTTTEIQTLLNFYDRDNDGLSDDIDDCPDAQGPSFNNGCPEPVVIPEGPMNGDFKDSRDGQNYEWVRLNDGKKWMRQNLNFKVADSYCYDDKGKNCNSTGRLYTWHAAQKACPQGWRLPTEYDWKRLVDIYGGSQAAFQALTKGGSSPLDVQLGGLRLSDRNFCCKGEFGNYWSKDHSTSRASYADFNSFYNAVQQETHDKNTALSCRCIQE